MDPRTSCCLFCSVGATFSGGVCVAEWLMFEASGVSRIGIAEGVLRVLKENFFGGLKVLRMVWSFSDSALMV
jgi:hypothetical protein